MSSPSRWIAHSSRGEHKEVPGSYPCFAVLPSAYAGRLLVWPGEYDQPTGVRWDERTGTGSGLWLACLLWNEMMGCSISIYLKPTERTIDSTRGPTRVTLRGQIHSIGSGHYIWSYGLRNMVYGLISMDYRLRTQQIGTKNKTLRNEQNPTDIGSKNEERSRQYIHLSIYHLPYLHLPLSIYHFAFLIPLCTFYLLLLLFTFDLPLSHFLTHYFHQLFAYHLKGLLYSRTNMVNRISFTPRKH